MSGASPVGIIGLGLLGSAMARRLRAASFDVVGFDVDAAKAQQLAAIGGKPTVSIAELARASSPIILAVFDTDQVEAVVEKELVPALGDGSGKIVLCTSTCDPDRIAALAARVKDRGICFLETPVSGSSAQAAAGEGVALIGGDAALVAEADDVLAALFPVRFHVGKIGDGGRAKLAINLILGLNRLALAEGLVFAERVGLDLDAFLAMAKKSAAYSQVMDIKGDKMVHSDFAAQGKASQHLKDIHLMFDQAERVGQPLPALRVHADVLEACVDHDQGELDNSVIIAELRRRGEEGPGAALLPLKG